MHMRALIALLIGVVALAAAGLVASACGGDDDDGGTSATSPAVTATPGSGPGTITLTSSAITGQSGKILLIYTTSGSDRLARACVSITSDNFTVPATVMTDVPSGNDPCGGDTSDTSFDEGAYSITAGVYVGGQQTAEKEATLSVDVAGDVIAELNGAELSQ
jgi:hypothetical protein